MTSAEDAARIETELETSMKREKEGDENEGGMRTLETSVDLSDQRECGWRASLLSPPESFVGYIVSEKEK